MEETAVDHGLVGPVRSAVTIGSEGRTVILFDQRGRVTATARRETGQGGQARGEHSKRFEYDEAGRLRRIITSATTFGSPGGSRSPAPSQETTFEYKDGHLVRQTDAAFGRRFNVVTWRYDDLGRVTEHRSRSEIGDRTPEVTRYRYDAPPPDFPVAVEPSWSAARVEQAGQIEGATLWLLSDTSGMKRVEAVQKGNRWTVVHLNDARGHSVHEFSFVLGVTGQQVGCYLGIRREYDPRGNPATEQAGCYEDYAAFVEGRGDVLGTVEFDYQLDERGNWTALSRMLVREDVRQSGPASRREVTYY